MVFDSARLTLVFGSWMKGTFLSGLKRRNGYDSASLEVESEFASVSDDELAGRALR